jgi:hypothetical protein
MDRRALCSWVGAAVVLTTAMVSHADQEMTANAAAVRAVGDTTPVYTILSPKDGDTCNVGDTMHIRWGSTSTGVDIFISADEGLTWLLVNVDGTVMRVDPNWDNFPFVVPDQLQGTPLTAVPLMLKLEGYNHGNTTVMDGHFFVRALSGTRRGWTAARGASGLEIRGSTSCGVAVGGLSNREPAVIAVYQLDGTVVCRRTVAECSSVNIDFRGFGAGFYMVGVASRSGRLVRPVSAFR